MNIFSLYNTKQDQKIFADLMKLVFRGFSKVYNNQNVMETTFLNSENISVYID